MSFSYRSKIFLMSTALICAYAVPAAAQSAPAQDGRSIMGDIVVTAQKREERLQDVGVSITAFNADQIEKLNIPSSTELVALAPNVESRQVWGGRGVNTLFFIRGVGQTDINDATESPVTAYVDEFYLISSASVDFLLHDIERAEVLRGPQGTIFGRNSTGGAIQFVTKKPQFSTGGAIEGEYGEYDSVSVKAHANLPVTEKVAVRVSGAFERNDPYIKNVNPKGDGIQEGNFVALRGQVLVEPTDRLSMLVKYEYGRAKGHLLGDSHIGLKQVPGDVVVAPTDGFGYSETKAGVESPHLVNADGYNFVDNRVHHALGRLVWEGDAVTITSVTGYLDQDKKVFEDCDGSPNSACSDRVFFKSRHFSQELRLNGELGERLNWTAGGYYLWQKASAVQNAALFFGSTAPALGVPGATGLVFDVDWDQTLNSYALFGQVEYKLTNALTLIAGARLSRDEKHFEQSKVDFLTNTSITNPRPRDWDSFPFFVAAGGVIFTDETAGQLTRMNKNSVSTNVQLNWKPNEDTLVYGSFRRAVKAGGFNNGFINNVAIKDIPYREETLYAYELGLKATLVDGHVRFNAATFYYDYQDYQASSFANLGVFVTNADASIYGGEAELTVNPAAGLDILIGASLLHTKAKDISNLGVVKDRKMGTAPSFTASGTIRYGWSGLGGDFSAQITGSYTGERYTDVLNNSAMLLEDYVQVDANVEYAFSGDRWTVGLYAQNLFGTNVAVSRYDLSAVGGVGQENFIAPRRVGVRAGFKF